MTGPATDWAALDDLVTFARLEAEANDLEPWAEIMAVLRRKGQVNDEEAHWLVSLYNTYDALGSAWSVFRRWPTPYHWAAAPDHADAASYTCTQERRNLRGGKVLLRLDSYVAQLAGDTQRSWLSRPLQGDPYRDFLAVMSHTRTVWGVGRQSAFEWAEFAAKVLDLPIDAPDAQLWESEGPRRSIQRIYNAGDPKVSNAWLHENAVHAKTYLAENGVDLPWVDFETVICDFNVMRDGRYYPGRHLAALREEIEEITDDADRAMLLAAFQEVAPGEWAAIAPGIDPEQMVVYRNTGHIIDTPKVAS